MPEIITPARRPLGRLFAALAALAIGSVAATDAAAQEAFPQELAEMFEFDSESAKYVLTERTLAQVLQATRQMKLLADSAFEEIDSVAALDMGLYLDDDGGEPRVSVGMLTTVFDMFPRLRNTITDAGLSTREYSTFILGMIYSAIQFAESGEKGMAETSPTVQRNIAFIGQNAEALVELGEALQIIGAASTAAVERGDIP